jgi:hypothetical protein
MLKIMNMNIYFQIVHMYFVTNFEPVWQYFRPKLLREYALCILNVYPHLLSRSRLSFGIEDSGNRSEQ